MLKAYMTLGALLLLLYSAAEWNGWELSGNTKKGLAPASARSAGGFRSYSYWNGGK